MQVTPFASPQSNRTLAAALARRGLSDLRGSAPVQAVVLGHPSPVMLCGLETIVTRDPRYRVAGSSSRIEELFDRCVEAGDCIALFDPFMGTKEGAMRRPPVQAVVEVMDAMRRRAPRARAVLIGDVPPALIRAGLGHGARGFVGESDDLNVVREALTTVATTGQCFLSVSVGARLASVLNLHELTQREMDVLRVLSHGGGNKIIARELDISYGTVKCHVRQIMQKLDARSRTEVLTKAGRLGLVRMQ